MLFVAGVVAGATVVAIDVTSELMGWPHLPITLHNDALALALGLTLVGAVGRALDRGIDVGRRIERSLADKPGERCADIRTLPALRTRPGSQAQSRASAG